MDVAIVDLFSVTVVVSVGELVGIQSQIKEALLIIVKKKCEFCFLLWSFGLQDFFWFIYHSLYVQRKYAGHYLGRMTRYLNIFGLTFATSVTSPLSVLTSGFIKG